MTTVVTDSPNRAVVNTNVTFTATVVDVKGAPVTSGTVQFYDGTAATGTPLGTPVAVSSSGVAMYQTNSLSIGSHTITAVYIPGDSYLGSSGTVTQAIYGVPAFIVITPSTQSTIVGTAFATQLTATVTDINHNPVGGVTVVWTTSGATNGANVTLAPASDVTNSSGVVTTTTLTANTIAGSYSV